MVYKINAVTAELDLVGIDSATLTTKLGAQTANAIPYGNGTTSPLGWTGALTDGQIPIGSTAGHPAAGSITSTGGSVTVTLGSNTINLETLPGLGTIEVTGTSASMAVNIQYIANNAGLVTLTLPVTAALGSTIRVIGKGAGLWLIAQNASQLIHISSSVSTTGVGGSISATSQYDCIVLACTVANTTFTAISMIGNITVT